MHTLILHVCRCISLLLTARKMLGFVILVWLFPRVFEQTSYLRVGVRFPWLWHLWYDLYSSADPREMLHAACAQNNLAGILCQCRGCTDAGPLFRWFHWLPVMQWVTCKVAVTAYKVRVRATPACLGERPGANPHAGTVTAVIRCSADGCLLDLHWPGWSTFSVLASSIRNSQPAEVWLCHSTAAFKRH